MKKLFKVLLLMVLVISVGIQVYAKNDSNDVKIKEETKVKIGKEEKKEYTLKIIEDKGNTVFTFEDVADEDIEEAHKYINQLIESGAAEESYIDSKNMDVEYYLNEWGYDTNDAIAYGWARNITEDYTGLQWQNNTWGGSSAGWYGSGSLDHITLNQATTFSEFGVTTISWPPSWSGSSTSQSWSSDPMSSNPSGATHPNIKITGIYGVSAVTQVIVNDGADIYVVGNGHIYRPQTYLRFKVSAL